MKNFRLKILSRILTGGFLFFSALSLEAKIGIPVGNYDKSYIVPRSQIKNYIQKRSLKDDLRQKRVKKKKKRVADTELLSIPDRYLPPALQKKKALLMKKYARKNQRKKKVRKKTKYVNVNGQKVKIAETIVLDGATGGSQSTRAKLLAKRKLPKVELIQEISVKQGKEIRTEVEPGERREVLELFENGNTKDKAKTPLLWAFQHYKRKDYASAISFSLKILGQKSNRKSTRIYATYILAHSLYQAGFYASALTPLIQLVDSPLRRSAFGMLARSVEKTRDTGTARKVLAKVSLSQMPEQFRELYAYHLGRILLAGGKSKAAMSAFSQVKDNSKHYGEAQYYTGLVIAESLPNTVPTKDWNRSGSRVYEARAHLDTAAEAALISGNDNLKNLVNLSLARLAYQSRLYNQSVFYYTEVEPGSSFSREAIFEVSWALYRLSEFNRSLGQLHPMGSPYYEPRDFPELWILRALNYLKLCRFDESNRAINTFLRDYNSTQRDIKRALGQLGGSKLNKLSQLENLNIPDWVKRIFVSDPVYIKDSAQEERLLREKAALQVLKTNPNVPEEALRIFSYNYLRKRIDAKVKTLTNTSKPYLVGRLKDLRRSYIQQKEKIDLLKFEIYSQATKHPDAINRAQAKKLIKENKFLPGVFLKGHETLWRFTGEYWLDELRGYDYFIPTECTKT